eukprot:364750-Chlamydomonas_euryale.AAC.1
MSSMQAWLSGMSADGIKAGRLQSRHLSLDVLFASKGDALMCRSRQEVGVGGGGAGGCADTVKVKRLSLLARVTVCVGNRERVSVHERLSVCERVCNREHMIMDECVRE